jgi:hypothetical protein
LHSKKLVGEDIDYSAVEPSTPKRLKSEEIHSKTQSDPESGIIAQPPPSSGGIPMNPNEFNFKRDSYSLASLACVIGVICSLLGVGGGEMYGPLMLAYHVMPQVSSATTSTEIRPKNIPVVLPVVLPVVENCTCSFSCTYCACSHVPAVEVNYRQNYRINLQIC